MRKNWIFKSLVIAIILIFSANLCYARGADSGINSTGDRINEPTKVSLKDEKDLLLQKDVWENFYNLTQVPRSSHHEEQISAYLADFGRGLALETVVDDVGNVLIRKPATAGMENRTGVVLQAHMDMVAQKNADKDFDFLKDPIEAYVEDGWVRANGTTLGADDGIGVAAIMAILQDRELAHGPLEALFTVNEEDGFTGINGLQPDLLQGKIYINVDSETEGEFTIGSAGGLYVDARDNYSEEKTPARMAGFRVSIKGLKGGHSGVDIGLGRGNAGKILSRMLWTAQRSFGLRIASLDGGDRYNAIPREAYAVVAVPEDEADSFAGYVQQFQATVQNELTATEPDLVIKAEKTDLPARVMDARAAIRLISAVYSCPNGVMRMSDAVPGLVETSSSMGILKAENGEFWAGFYVRSAKNSARDDLGDMIRSIFELAGGNVSFHDSYSGWAPNPDSHILGLMKQIYQEKFGHEPKVIAIHAGLETSVVGEKYPGMDMISLGPTLQDVHTPNECLNVSTVPKVYDLLTETLMEVAPRD
ncbi:MAG TPA: aminoacyl-histidine dipeptidase [Methanothrix soehngenii]|nr:aminoacyl-histidine dipeptidase [Methanothrix soehngenii]